MQAHGSLTEMGVIEARAATVASKEENTQHINEKANCIKLSHTVLSAKGYMNSRLRNPQNDN